MSAAITRGVPDIAPRNAIVSGMLMTTGKRSPRLALTPGDRPSTFTASTSRHSNKVAQNA
jgi:hypothetical protein